MNPMKFSKQDGFSTRVYKRVKGYMKRRKNYVRLGRNARNEPGNHRRRFWQVRITRKLKLKLNFKLKLKFLPKKMLIKIRDGYINMMMRMANSQAVVGNYGCGGIAKFETTPIKEYDDKMIIEIYKVLAMRQKAQIQAQAQAHVSDSVSRINVSR